MVIPLTAQIANRVEEDDKNLSDIAVKEEALDIIPLSLSN